MVHPVNLSRFSAGMLKMKIRETNIQSPSENSTRWLFQRSGEAAFAIFGPSYDPAVKRLRFVRLFILIMFCGTGGKNG